MTEYTAIVETDTLDAMLTKAMAKDGSLPFEISVETATIGGKGKTITYGNGTYRYHSFSPPTPFNFEINAGTSKTEPVILTELEVVIEPLEEDGDD